MGLHALNERDEALIRGSTGASSIETGERIQRLWSGYGEIVRVRLTGASVATVVVKRVRPPSDDGTLSHRRKLASYDIEQRWYVSWARRCEGSRVPRAYAAVAREGGWTFVLEDLDGAGFPGRRRRLAPTEIDRCVRWLARFHATFLGARPEGLWERGTYWHLATRPDEHARIADAELRAAAEAIDTRLSAAHHRTIVHGDAKVANFCFGAHDVAAVDFQYVGGGVGPQDLVYFLGSVLSSDELPHQAERWVDRYFAHLGEPEVEAEWRPLVPFAWADFHRFLAGWAPDEHRHDRYAEQVTRALLRDL